MKSFKKILIYFIFCLRFPLLLFLILFKQFYFKNCLFDYQENNIFKIKYSIINISILNDFLAILNKTANNKIIERENNQSRIEIIQISSSIGRYSNQGLQFDSAILLSFFFSVKILIIPKNFLFINHPFIIEDLNLLVTFIQPNIFINGILKHHFWGSPKPSLKNCMPLYRNYIINNLPKSNINSMKLYFHIRSGDVYDKKVRPNPPYNYAQPPLGYYMEIMSNHLNLTLEIISEDTLSPITKKLIKFGLYWEKHEAKYDISRVLRANYLAIGVGTFSMYILKLAGMNRTLYTFNDKNVDIGTHLNCIPSNIYNHNILNQWKRSKEQYEFLLNQSCFEWENI